MKRTLLRKSKGGFMAHIPADELLTGIKDLSNGAYQLLMYYYTKGDGWEFEDKEMSESINTSIRMVRQYRRELIDKKYLMIMKGTVDVYFIGRQAVLDFEEPENKDSLLDQVEHSDNEDLRSTEEKV